MSESVTADVPDAARRLFAEHAERAAQFVALLREHGVERGLIGPREIDRLWDRHVLNSAAIAGLLPDAAAVVDVGSGGGFPGVPLAIARPDLTITLLEPMARRVAWLEEVVTELGLTNASVLRGRAEDVTGQGPPGGFDVATARAVAPLAKLTRWCLPLVRPGGMLVAIKGASAPDEVERDRAAIRKSGGDEVQIHRCGDDLGEAAATVVTVTARKKGGAGRSSRRR